MVQEGSSSNLWKFLFTVEILTALFIAIILLLTVERPKTVLFVYGDTSERIETTADTMEQFLSEQSIQPGPYDKFSPAMDVPLKDGITIEYQAQQRVKIEDGRDLLQVITAGTTVREALAAASITLGPWDRVQPAIHKQIQRKHPIRITRIDKQQVEEVETIAYESIHKKDFTLPQGKKRIIQEGKEGKVVNRYEVVLENGKEVAKRLTHKKLLQKKQDQIVAIGALAVVSRGGKQFLPRKVLRNVELTAYAAGKVHTGKEPGHPQYGITRSGSRATEGRTVAVDPGLIPLGSWVYIEGYGFRRAEDTGSAVRNKRIDIYFEDDQRALSFGLKRTPTVYVIGPNYPK
jgi:3D (Asp-Asp-Asp) domain-containing protein